MMGLTSSWTTFPRGPLTTWLVNPREESGRGEIIRAEESHLAYPSEPLRPTIDGAPDQGFGDLPSGELPARNKDGQLSPIEVD